MSCYSIVRYAPGAISRQLQLLLLPLLLLPTLIHGFTFHTTPSIISFPKASVKGPLSFSPPHSNFHTAYNGNHRANNPLSFQNPSKQQITRTSKYTTLKLATAATSSFPFLCTNANNLLNALSVPSGMLLLLLYHVRLVVKERQGMPTWRSVQADTREEWAKYVRSTEGWLYAIQTLRNAITANTFLATTVLSLLTVMGGRFLSLARASTNLATPSQRRLCAVQIGSVVLTMLMSAYEFLQSARLMTHAGFMFPVVKDTTKADRIMRKSQNAQWLGLRWLYVSLAMISWTFGNGHIFLLSALLLVQFFRHIDRVPLEARVDVGSYVGGVEIDEDDDEQEGATERSWL